MEKPTNVNFRLGHKLHFALRLSAAAAAASQLRTIRRHVADGELLCRVVRWWTFAQKMEEKWRKTGEKWRKTRGQWRKNGEIIGKKLVKMKKVGISGRKVGESRWKNPHLGQKKTHTKTQQKENTDTIRKRRKPSDMTIQLCCFQQFDVFPVRWVCLKLV